ncbi:MAG: tRNA (adenosine(37)-N6)-dimethylallyltransferase MiaA [Bacteroidales bacterium]|nr:tRNA (adenosine(37)-N6)-dimethylallyltransferase MiaA [Bacteroidales bacterium]
MITILGPTATGKTKLAAHVAAKLNGEVISADSRQVYKGMDLCTGKDYDDYIVDGNKIPYFLIDIVDPGYEYNVYEYQRDFLKIYKNIISRQKLPVLCGGTGLYIEAVLKGYKLVRVPENNSLRKKLEKKKTDELTKMLSSFRSLHNVTDSKDRERLIRAIEIQNYYKENPDLISDFPKIKNEIFGINFDRNIIRRRITERLKARLESGMVDEVNNLLSKGITPEQLKFYGLEYKYITQYIIGELNYNDMFQKLNTAIHQFAKRQITWFRRMERNGFKIHWIDGNSDIEYKVNYILENLNHKKRGTKSTSFILKEIKPTG